MRYKVVVRLELAKPASSTRDETSGGIALGCVALYDAASAGADGAGNAVYLSCSRSDARVIDRSVAVRNVKKLLKAGESCRVV